MPESTPRYFTPEEANVLLPEVLERLSQVTDRVRRVRQITEGAHRVEGDEPAIRERLHALQGEVEHLLDWIQAAGVHVKGVEPALLDFPALRHGSEVYLCWREGEGTVDHWHPLHTGYTGRQPLDPADIGIWEWCN